MKRLLSIGIILLFIGMSISSSTGFNLEKKPSITTANGNTLYVGGSGEGNYTKIQDAIDNASDGDTVFVYNGTYYENLIINKSISLIGEDKISTIIFGDGSGDVVNVSADWVNISDFNIQNSGKEFWDAGIQISSNYSYIHNNYVKNCENSIFIIPSYRWAHKGIYYNRIANNTLKDNYYGLHIVESSYSLVYDNRILNNFYGIFASPYNIPIKNKNINPIHMGYNNFNRNNITNNNYGIYLFLTYHDYVYENEIFQNENGIVLEGWYGHGRKNIVFYNNIIKNNLGILIYSLNGGANSNNIHQNNIIQNYEGILIFCSGGWFSEGAKGNIIYRNNIMNNNKGISIKKQFLTTGGSNNHINQNNFIGNLEYHAQDNCNNNWNNGSIGNYWDDWSESGPYLIIGKRGRFGFIPRFNFDWHPAQEPYSLEV